MMFASVAATEAEKRVQRPGDDLVDPADVVMDRAFTVPGLPEQVWPWLVQLGKQRAGWYLPARAERFLPRSRRAARTVNPAWLGLRPGDVIPDYGGRHETFEVAAITAPSSLVYRSRRGHTDLTWSLTLEPAPGPPGADPPGPTRRGLPAGPAGRGSSCGCGWHRSGISGWPARPANWSTCSRWPGWRPACTSAWPPSRRRAGLANRAG